MKEKFKVEFTSLEACILVFNNTMNNLINAVKFQDDATAKLNAKLLDYAKNENLPKIPTDEEGTKLARRLVERLNAEPETIDIKSLSMILYEYTIINLRKLLEIHPILVRHLEELGEIELERSLQDFWQPIEKLKKRILQWRNKFAAHAKDNAEKHLKFTDIDEKYEFLPKEIFFASICAILYGSGIAVNLIEYSNTIKSHNRQIHYERNAFKIFEWENTHKEIGELIKKVKKVLEKNGYKNNIEYIGKRKYPRKNF